jgi:hypothetical protein
MRPASVVTASAVNFCGPLAIRFASSSAGTTGIEPSQSVPSHGRSARCGRRGSPGPRQCPRPERPRRPRARPPPLDAVKRWMTRSGYPLEFEAARAFREAGFKVYQGLHYASTSGASKRREINVLAVRELIEANPRPVRTTALWVIECKMTQAPWLGLHGDGKGGRWEALGDIPLPPLRTEHVLEVLEPGMDPWILRNPDQPGFRAVVADTRVKTDDPYMRRSAKSLARLVPWSARLHPRSRRSVSRWSSSVALWCPCTTPLPPSPWSRRRDGSASPGQAIQMAARRSLTSSAVTGWLTTSRTVGQEAMRSYRSSATPGSSRDTSSRAKSGNAGRRNVSDDCDAHWRS